MSSGLWCACRSDRRSDDAPARMASKQTAAFIAACCVCWSFARATRATARANNVITNEELSFMDHPLSTLHEGVLGQGNENGAAKFRRSVLFVFGWQRR